MDWASERDDTLVIVTADHETGGLHVLASNGAGELPTVNWTGGGNHTGVNVPIYSTGSENAYLISGVMDNTQMFFVCTCTPGEGAWHPTPSDCAANYATSATLKWLASEDAVSFDIYFGTDFNDVNDANNTGTAFMSHQTAKSYLVGALGSSYSQAFEPNTTYYWRVDEINDVNYVDDMNNVDPNHICKGDIWSFIVPPEIAWNPNPTNNSEDVNANTVLNWFEAFGVKVSIPHHVYFGENYDDVLAGTDDTYKGLFAETYFDPGILDPGKTYYWRIDEILGIGKTKHVNTGDVWSFTVGEDIYVRVSSGEDDAEEGPGTSG